MAESNPKDGKLNKDKETLTLLSTRRPCKSQHDSDTSVSAASDWTWRRGCAKVGEYSASLVIGLIPCAVAGHPTALWWEGVGW